MTAITGTTGGMGWGRIHRAPLVIFPVALIAVAGRALWMNDPREILMSPISAAMMTVVAYPLAVLAIWLVRRFLPQLTQAGPGVAALVGVAAAELAFWALVHPFWQRDFSIPFLAALIAAFGLSTGLVLNIRRG